MFGHIAILFSIFSLAYCCQAGFERRLALLNVHEINVRTNSDRHQRSRNCRLYPGACNNRRHHEVIDETSASEADSGFENSYDSDDYGEIPEPITAATRRRQTRRTTRQQPTTRRPTQATRQPTTRRSTTTKQTRTTTRSARRTTTTTRERLAGERVIIVDNDSASFRHPKQPLVPEKAMENLRRAVKKALRKVLANMGLSPTVNFTIHDYVPDKVTINTIISNNTRKSRRKGGFIVLDDVVIARVNGRQYNKTLSLRVNQIGVSIPVQFWKQAGRSFAIYLKQYSKVLIHKMYVGPNTVAL